MQYSAFGYRALWFDKDKHNNQCVIVNHCINDKLENDMLYSGVFKDVNSDRM